MRAVSNLMILALMLVSGFSYANCSDAEIKQVRAEGLALYKSGDQQGAAKVLSRYYQEQCDYYAMSQTDDAHFNQGLWLISDLMLYRNKIGNPLGCLALGDEVYATFMVSDEGRHEPRVQKALQANLTSCKKSLSQAYTPAIQCPVAGYEYMSAIPSSWQNQNELLYELACIRFVENQPDRLGMDRDADKYQSEGMAHWPRFEVLTVNRATPSTISTPYEMVSVIEKQYQLDQLYITDEQGELWGQHCYRFSVNFGEQAGMIFLDGSSSICGGAGLFVNRVITKLDYPIKATVVKESSHIYK
ncbi:hypothetical protein [Ferrimonas aestuarii]|uniref:Uncharacterized protein n=1 Tax=Ferrimonas aestuarii TaxID=2569539 RepID=A0A4U1BPG2_9GAMM|nr:hypothetical protein [Ferrimonas aestuarii]TKB52008.1 hypothetical protein FCL42_16450 [Ferrimonas aestuarii]